MDADLKRAWFAAANGGDRDGLQRMLAEHPELLNLCDRHQVPYCVHIEASAGRIF